MTEVTAGLTLKYRCKISVGLASTEIPLRQSGSFFWGVLTAKRVQQFKL